MKTLAALTEVHGGEFVLRELDLDEPRADEVLVRIVGCGICHTDLIARDGVIPTPLPAVFGHEASGIVEMVGAGVADMAPGDPVVLTFMSCGECPACIANTPAYCVAMATLNFAGRRAGGDPALNDNGNSVSSHFFGQSSFATYALAHQRNAVKVTGHSLPLEYLGPLGCGIQTGAGTVMNVLKSGPAHSIAIFGGGPVGMSALLAAVMLGCRRIILVEPLAARRELALELGATDTIDPQAVKDVAQAIYSIEPAGVDHIVESCGKPSAIEAAIAATAKLGACALVGAPSKAGEIAALRFGLFVQNGVTLRGVIEGDSDPQRFIPELIALQAAGRFPFERLIELYDFAEINRAVTEQKAGLCLKAVLRMPQ